MYKKIILSIFLVFCLAGCTFTADNSKINENTDNQNTYVKSVFIAYYELSEFTKNSDKKSFTKSISKAFKELSNKGFNRVTVQVRPCADAFYNSSYFPTSEYCFGYQGAKLIYDPLEIMVQIAHKYNLSVEAWINPYRVCQRNDFNSLAKNNIALEWQGTDKLIVLDSGIYFNPCYSEVTDLIVNGVKEIILNYDVDSICFDDYFYPTKDKKIDKEAYLAYKNNKSSNKNITFGISPASDMDYDYSTLYADVIKWSRNEGYIDYICPQIYFGFKNENQPFMQTTKMWCDNATCKLYVALPMYKSNSDYIFSYSSLKDNEETSNVYSAMQNSSQ